MKVRLTLKSQRRLAAEILKVGESRVWMDPERIDEVESAISREEINKLIHEGIIRPLQKKGVSRARARILHQKKRAGLRRGHGGWSGAKNARTPRKQAWITKIRALRKKLLKLKNSHAITEKAYRRLYILAGSGVFDSVAELERYIKSHDLGRRR